MENLLYNMPGFVTILHSNTDFSSIFLVLSQFCTQFLGFVTQFCTQKHFFFFFFLGIAMASQANRNSVITHSNRRKKKTETVNSYLPEDVIENIFSFLPLKEVCRLSILSKRFKTSWKICRDLSFDRDFARHLSKEEYKTSVNNFFSSYSTDSAEKFKLYFDATAETPLVSRWICNAVTLRVTEFELDFSPSKKKFTLSYDLVNVDSIRKMKLVNCELHLPFESNGLRFLREITFQDVRAHYGLIHSIFLNCVSLRALKLVKCCSVSSLVVWGRALETLVVKDCYDVDSVVIKTRSLSTFHYHGKLTEFDFNSDLPRLNDVVFGIAHPRSFTQLSHRDALMNSLAYVETLTVSTTFLEVIINFICLFIKKLKNIHNFSF